MARDAGNESALDRADDAFLVARSRDGDVRAFGLLLRRHDRVLRRYIGRLTRNGADTDDVLQDTALQAWRNLDSLREPSNARAWMIQIATREALRLVASRRDHEELTDDAEVSDGPDLEVELLDTQRALQAALDALPQQQARCWVLRELGGFTYAQIADRLGIPESSVRGSLAQARKSIVIQMGGRR